MKGLFGGGRTRDATTKDEKRSTKMRQQIRARVAAHRGCGCDHGGGFLSNSEHIVLPALAEDFAQVWGKKCLRWWLQRAWSASAAWPTGEQEISLN